MTNTDSTNWLSLTAILAVIGAMALAIGTQDVRVTRRRTGSAAVRQTTESDRSNVTPAQRLILQYDRR
jgi:hypothetical protein